MNKWTKYTYDEVLTKSDANGNRLLSEFASDYYSVFHKKLCPNCNNFNEKFDDFLNKIKQMENIKKKNSGFVLKKIYENIPLEFGSHIYVNNDNITDAYGNKLLKEHPRGKELFELIPKKKTSIKSED